MPEKIIQVSKETLEKRIREGKIKLPGDPVEPSPVNTLGGIPTKEVGRRRFLLGAGATLAGVGLISFFAIKEANRQEAAKQEAIRQEAARQEAARQAEAVRQEAARQEAARRREAADRLYPGIIERAVALFGEDFLGEQAIHKIEDKYHAKGIDVKFEIPIIPFHLNISQLEAAKQDEKKGKARMVVLRPEFMTVKGERKPITILSLNTLFGKTNPFGSGQLFTYPYPDYYESVPYYYERTPFLHESLKAKFALPTKEVVPGSLGKHWNNQITLMEPGESSREAVEAVWDCILYYGATGKKILGTTMDRTKSLTFYGSSVCVGDFNSGRGLSMATLDLNNNGQEGDATNVGVCTAL